MRIEIKLRDFLKTFFNVIDLRIITSAYKKVQKNAKIMESINLKKLSNRELINILKKNLKLKKQTELKLMLSKKIFHFI